MEKWVLHVIIAMTRTTNFDLTSANQFATDQPYLCFKLETACYAMNITSEI